MATLKKIPDSYLTPARTLPQQELAEAHIENPAAARLLTYGERDPRLSDPPHDHGQDGGEVLLSTTVLSITFGPEKTLSGPQQGIQLFRGGSFSLFGERVILGTAGVPLRGGQTELSGLLVVGYDSIATLDFYVTLRPYAEANRDFGFGRHVTTQVTFTPGAAPEERALSFTLTDLSLLGDVRYDREVELVVWQAYEPPAPVTSGHRLMGVYLDVLTADGAARDTQRTELPRQTISYADIKSGAILGQDLGRKMRDTHNGLLRAMLGRAPGLTNDNRPDPTRPYVQPLFCAHQHQGIDVPDGCGGFWSDGAVLRDTLFAVSFCHSNTTSSSPDYTGALLHLTGTFDALALRVEARASIPAGLGALEIRFELDTEAREVNTQLFLHVDVRGFDGVSIATSVSSGVHQQRSERDVDGLWVCEVDPLDNNLFVPSRRRRLGQKGLWTLDALLRPDATTEDGMRPSHCQISEVVRVTLTHPKLRAEDTPHETGDYVVVLRWELQTPGSGTAVDPFSALRWVLGLPGRGF